MPSMQIWLRIQGCPMEEKKKLANQKNRNAHVLFAKIT